MCDHRVPKGIILIIQHHNELPRVSSDVWPELRRIGEMK